MHLGRILSNCMSEQPLAMIELDSVASGLQILDCMVKKAPIQILEANLIEPGHFLILLSGALACVEEALQEACLEIERLKLPLISKTLIPTAHVQLLEGLRGKTRTDIEDALGIIETQNICDALLCCDRVLKESFVTLIGIRIQGGLGGKGYFVVSGLQHDVEAALDVAQTQANLHRRELLARPHKELLPWLFRPQPLSL